MNNLQEIAEALAGSTRVLICGHVVPDGDCLGSVAALGLVLEAMGKQVTLASPDPLPETLMFLPGADRFCTDCGAALPDYDTFVALDCSVPARLGSFRSCLDGNLTVINIDHHVNSGGFARYNYLDSGAAATGEILMELFELMGASIGREVAICLYVALVTDTGSFQYENTSPGTLRKAARLMETGIQTALINTLLYEERPLKTLQVLGATLEKLQLSPCGRVAWAVVDSELLDRFSAGAENTDGLINHLRTIRDVEVAILFREIEKGRYKVGFRSKGKVNVHQLASQMGGGGHTRASGCVLEGDLTKIVAKVVHEAELFAAGDSSKWKGCHGKGCHGRTD